MNSEMSWTAATLARDKMFVNGIASDTVGLYVDTPPMPPMAAEKVITSDIAGLSGNQYTHTGVYEDITVTVRCFVFDYGYHPKLIYGFLKDAKTLYFSEAAEWYYRVKRVAGVTPQYQVDGKNVINIQFVCDPFRYRRQNIVQPFRYSPVTIRNFGNVYCEPLYKLKFDPISQAIGATFAVNDTSLQLLDLSGEVYVDLERKKIYKSNDGVLTIVQDQTSGKFWNMVLEPGENTMTWTEKIESVEVITNERYL